MNGGVATEDARALQLRMKEDAKYTQALQVLANDASNSTAAEVSSLTGKLIELSPEKKAGSRNTNLLVDLEGDTDARPKRQRYAEALVYSSNSKEGAGVNFLD